MGFALFSVLLLGYILNRSGGIEGSNPSHLPKGVTGSACGYGKDSKIVWPTEPGR